MLDERDPLEELAEARARVESVRRSLRQADADGQLGQLADRLERIERDLARVGLVVEQGLAGKVGR